MEDLFMFFITVQVTMLDSGGLLLYYVQVGSGLQHEWESCSHESIVLLAPTPTK